MGNLISMNFERVVVFILFSVFCQYALATKPEYITDKKARWEFVETTDAKGTTGMWSHINIQGNSLAFYYDAQSAKLKFNYSKNNNWIDEIGEVTVDGEMLSAYSACYQENSGACIKRGSSFELYMDSRSIEQLKNGSELRTTLKFSDDSLRTFSIPLVGTTKAINKLQASWKEKAATTDLMFALLHRDTNHVKKFIASGQDVNAIDKAGRTPLSIVLPRQYEDEHITEVDKALIKLLVAQGANINLPKHNPPLHTHIKGNAETSFIDFLLGLGADPDLKNRDGTPAIILTYNHPDFKKIYKSLVIAGANKFATDTAGRSLLHQVSSSTYDEKKALKKIEFLLKEGYKIDTKDDAGMTPLLYALMAGNGGNGRFLVKNGADTNPKLKNGKKIQDELREVIAKAKETGHEKNKVKYTNILAFLEAAEVIEIAFKNKTSDTIKVAIHYKNLDGKWVTKQWYTIEPGEDGSVAETNNTLFYYYADTEGSAWSGTDKYLYVQGYDKKKGFRKKTVAKRYRGDIYTVSFSD